MSVDKIIAKIIADAEVNANETKANAEKKAADLKSRLLSQARQKVAEIDLQADFDVKEIERRQALIAELESRKSLLAVRRKVLDNAFALAKKKLEELPPDKWETLMTRYIIAACETGSEKLCVPEKDRDKYQNYLLEKLNKILKEQGKAGNLSLIDQSAHFNGGVMVIGKDSDYDFSFEAILRGIRSENEKQTADILFVAEV